MVIDCSGGGGCSADLSWSVVLSFHFYFRLLYLLLLCPVLLSSITLAVAGAGGGDYRDDHM